MRVTETHSEGLKREYKIVVPADEIEAQIVEKLGDLRDTVQIKGFRPGKAPMSLLRKRYESSVTAEVIENTVNRSSHQAMTDQGVRPALPPEFEFEKFEKGNDLEYKMSIEALPEIEPADPKNLELTRLKAEVTDQAVEEALAGLAAQQKSFSEADAAHAAAEGDAVRIDLVGRIDGEPFDGGAAEDRQVELGSGTFLPGFEEQLVGAKAGDSVEVKVTFPQAYPNEELAGKEAVFAVDVKQVLLRDQVAVNDALATQLGMADLAALRAAARERIQREYNQTARFRLKRQVLDSLAASHDFTVPAGMVDREFDAIWTQIEQDMERAGTSWETADQTEDEAREDYRGIAERRVRLGLLLSEIGRRNDIAVPQEELNRAVMEQARRHPGQEQQVFDYFRNNPQAMSELHAPLYEDKVVDFLIEMADVTDRTVSPQELRRDAEQGQAANGAKDEEAERP